MQDNPIQDNTIQNTSPSQQLSQDSLSHTYLRIRRATDTAIKNIVASANDKKFGRKIKHDDLLDLALTLVRPEHIKKLQDQSLSNADLLELNFRDYQKNNTAISRDEFIGKLLRGELNLSK